MIRLKLKAKYSLLLVSVIMAVIVLMTWCMIAQLQKGPERIIPISIGLAILFSLVGILGSIFIAGRLVKPVEQLKEAANKISKGDFTARMPVLSRDEMGELAASFNQMIQALQTTTVTKSYVDNIIRSMIDALVVIDQDAKIRTVNQATCDLLGYKREELIGKSIRKIFPEEEKATQEASEEEGLVFKGPTLNRLVEEGVLYNQEVVYKAKEGWTIPMLFSGSIMYDQNQGMVVVTIARDITELKKAQEELNRQADELARSNRELEQFAYVASHDLREPLRKISSYTQLLAQRYQGKLDENADKFIGYITDGSSRMEKLIDDLLTYSRVGKKDIPMEETDLNMIVGRVLGDLERAIKEKGATVTLDSLPRVMANATQIGQLLQNLIANGMKFQAKEGEVMPPQIHIGAERTRNEWVISVKDNGIGIEPQYAERIFVMFQRLHTREEYPGTGIGLAVCKKIVERHGGRIWVKSELGKGACFYFSFPVLEAGIHPVTKKEEGQASAAISKTA